MPAGAGRGVTRIHHGHTLWDDTTTDFWIHGSSQLAVVTGWTSTSIALGTSHASDFNDAADAASMPTWGTDASTDLLVSPDWFGDKHAFDVQATLLGFTPTQLVMEVYGVILTNSANETAAGFGLAGATGATITNHVAYIFSDSANFNIRTGATTTDSGIAVDTNFHNFKVVITTGGSTEWFIDGSSQGTVANMTDMFPCGFSLSASTTNRPFFRDVHIYYQ